jgi:pimeloyl-ACP methyl ester carboxylesterase
LLAAAQWTTGALADQLNAALHFAVTCAEDAPRVTAADREALARTRSGALAANVLAVCDVWPRGAPAAPSTPLLPGDVPVLVLSGGLDPVTPPANGAAVAAQFRNSRHIVAPGYGHIVSPHACGPQLIAAFVATPDGSRLPAACVEHFEKSVRSLLWPDRMGPQP